MADELVYPASLPCPQTSAASSVERRLMAPADRPLYAVAASRDRIIIENVTWPPMSPAKFVEFRRWWRDDLLLGGAWFAADWPLPSGSGMVARRFIGAPRWEWVSGGFWRVSASTEVRVRGELPMHYPVVEVPILLETFTGPDGFNIGYLPMDIVMNGGAWQMLGDSPVPAYDGEGNAVSGNGDPSPGAALVSWGDFNGFPLRPGWRFELTLNALQGLPTGSPASTIFELYEYSSEQLYSTLVVIDDRIRVTATYADSEESVAADYDLPAGEFTFVMRFTTYTTAIVSINGVDQAPIEFEFGFMFWIEYMYLVVGAMNAEPDEPTTKFSRIAIYNGPE